MVNIFLVALGCVHLFAVGVIVGATVAEREDKKQKEKDELKMHQLAEAIYILNNEYKKLYHQVNKEDKTNED